VLFEELELELAGGLTTCLLGPSGVGKSSLLRLLAGLGPAPTGCVQCDDGGPLAGRSAYMDQRDLLLPWLSGRDNVTLGARLRGDKPDRARADELLARVGLEDRQKDRPAMLSGGERQRLALARTLMEDRPIVLMDEPFSSLDALTRLKLQDLAAELLAGRTVLLVTHDPMEALRLGHRIFVMKGSPARLGTPLEAAGPPPRDAARVSRGEAYRDLLHRLGVGGSA
jgi:putative hydroxymethylpyrimidine transport system ATP-binding protein